MPPHHWVPIRLSDPKKRKQELKRALGSRGQVVRFWSGKKKNRGYALVAGSVDDLPAELLAGPTIVVEDDDDLDDVD